MNPTHILAACAVATAAWLAPGSAQAAQEVCGPMDSGKVDTTGDPLVVEITATPGYRITGYCVKAGSSQSTPTPVVYVTVDPPALAVSISHPSGKAVSHYAWSEDPYTPPPTTAPPTTEPPATTAPPTTAPPTTPPPPPTVPPTTPPPATQPPVTTGPPLLDECYLWPYEDGKTLPAGDFVFTDEANATGTHSISGIYCGPPPTTQPPVATTIPGPTPELPETGTGSWVLAALAAALLATGTAITAATRRPTSKEAS